MRILNNERIFMKTPKPKLTYSRQLDVEVPSRSLFEKLQSELTPYFIDGTDNTCTWETFSELATYIRNCDLPSITDSEVRAFIVSVVETAEGEIGDVVFYCSNQQKGKNRALPGRTKNSQRTRLDIRDFRRQRKKGALRAWERLASRLPQCVRVRGRNGKPNNIQRRKFRLYQFDKKEKREDIGNYQ